jgi:hypothetical protein
VVIELMPYLPLRPSEFSKQNKLKRREEHQSKSHKTVKLTRIPSDTLINSK